MLLYTFIITTTLCFSLLQLVIMDNNLSPFYDSNYDYVLYNFDEKNIEEIKNNKDVNDIYANRIVNLKISKGNKTDECDINFVDHWDKKNISCFGDNRKIIGKFSNDDNGIVLDYFTAKKLGAKTGDTVKICVGKTNIKYKVCMIIEPNKQLFFHQAICLYNDYFIDTYLKEYNQELVYSELYVDANDNKNLEDYFFDSYIGPGMSDMSEKEIKETNRVTITKKDWQISDSKFELEHTPIIIICISMFGMVIIFIFLLRENRTYIENIEKNIAILTILGNRYKNILKMIILGQMMLIFPSVVVSGCITKIIYNILIKNYYLSLSLLTTELLIILAIVLVMLILIGNSVVKKYKKNLLRNFLMSK